MAQVLTGEEAGKLVAEKCMSNLRCDVETAWIEAGRPQKTIMFKRALRAHTVRLLAELLDGGLHKRAKEIATTL